MKTFKQFVSASKTMGLGLSLLVCAGTSIGADKDDVLIFSFFRGNGQAGTYLAMSEDGLHFTPLNHDQPVMKPAPWNGQSLTRDPSMVYHDGVFHAVWTSGWKGNCFGYAESQDLVHWSAPLKVTPFPTNQIPANTWAPLLGFPAPQNLRDGEFDGFDELDGSRRRIATAGPLASRHDFPRAACGGWLVETT